MEKASKEWAIQRVTACIVVISSLLFFAGLFFLKCKKASLLDGLFLIMTSPFGAVFLIMTFFSIMYHGAIGMKIILEDYISNVRLRGFIVNLLFIFSYFIIGIITLTIITVNIKYTILHP